MKTEKNFINKQHREADIGREENKEHGMKNGS